jgi:hypothetical protein
MERTCWFSLAETHHGITFPIRLEAWTARVPFAGLLLIAFGGALTAWPATPT